MFTLIYKDSNTHQVYHLLYLTISITITFNHRRSFTRGSWSWMMCVLLAGCSACVLCEGEPNSANSPEPVSRISCFLQTRHASRPSYICKQSRQMSSFMILLFTGWPKTLGPASKIYPGPDFAIRMADIRWISTIPIAESRGRAGNL